MVTLVMLKLEMSRSMPSEGSGLTFLELKAARNTVIHQCCSDWICRNAGDCICFGKITLESGCIQCSVCLSVSPDMHLTAFWRGSKVDLLPETVTITSVHQLATIIGTVDRMKECAGVTGDGFIDLNSNASISRYHIGQYDKTKSSWRHINCVGLFDPTTGRACCRVCWRYRSILQGADNPPPKKNRTSQLHMDPQQVTQILPPQVILIILFHL